MYLSFTLVLSHFLLAICTCLSSGLVSFLVFWLGIVLCFDLCFLFLFLAADRVQCRHILSTCVCTFCPLPSSLLYHGCSNNSLLVRVGVGVGVRPISDLVIKKMRGEESLGRCSDKEEEDGGWHVEMIKDNEPQSKRERWKGKSVDEGEKMGIQRKQGRRLKMPSPFSLIPSERRNGDGCFGSSGEVDGGCRRWWRRQRVHARFEKERLAYTYLFPNKPDTTPLMGKGKSRGRGGGGGRGGGKAGASSSVSTSGDTPVCKTDRIAEAQAQELDSLAELFGDALVLRGDPPQKKGDKCGHFAVTVKRGELIGDNDDDENGTKNEIKLVILHL